MTSSARPALSILVATWNRPDSVRETLAHLAACRCGEPYEVVLVDNGSEPPLTSAVLDVPGLAPSRLLRELRPGKSHALNRALDEGGLGEIVAVLDDDMSPATGWIEGVLAASRRLPQFDVFSGRSHVVWPAGVDVPAWARTLLAQGLQFSIFDAGQSQDVEFGIQSPRFPSGNHFWFRRSLADAGARFPDAWTTEAHLVVDLGRKGHRGVFVPGVDAGHRIDAGLLDPAGYLKRARRFGREMARIEAWTERDADPAATTRAQRWSRSLRAAWAWSGWWFVRLATALVPDESRRLTAQARALWGLAYHRERLAAAWQSNAAAARVGDVFTVQAQRMERLHDQPRGRSAS